MKTTSEIQREIYSLALGTNTPKMEMAKAARDYLAAYIIEVNAESDRDQALIMDDIVYGLENRVKQWSAE